MAGLSSIKRLTKNVMPNAEFPCILHKINVIRLHGKIASAVEKGETSPVPASSGAHPVVT